jgi:hypothetical protein
MMEAQPASETMRVFKLEDAAKRPRICISEMAYVRHKPLYKPSIKASIVSLV